jgi:biotin transport system substrate-specific component
MPQPYDDDNKIKKMVLAALFAALIAVGAYIKIPVPGMPIPISLQTFFVLLAILLLGCKWGTISILIYTLVGLIGFPVFSGGPGGPGILLGVTGGYVYSFIIVAVVVGYLSERVKKTFFSILILAVLGSVMILGIGTMHMAFFTSFGIQRAFVIGFLPFVIGDFLKSIAVAVTSILLLKKYNFAQSSDDEEK